MSSRLQIALVPFGDANQTILSWLEEDLPGIFSADVEVTPALPLPPKHFVKDRDQYLADGLLDEFSSIVSAPATLLLGISEADLFSPGMNFIFGIANRGRALISTFRLRPEFFGQDPNPRIFRRRILTEAVHELGHALGLTHCEYPGCVMFFSNWIGDTDRKGPGFCFRCSRTLERAAVTSDD
ncbi:MAG: archaemetzincin family Zn-dependent metalloprotease [Methanomicrobiales archaeon]|nr:archaemetzincin family Zn-dependent metalloprotease [Methanomicrobiales archaeon]